MRCFRAGMAAVFGLLIVSQAGRAAIVAGQIDTFEDALNPTLNWSNGASNLTPADRLDGGPGGAGDHYMRLRSSGSGAGGRLVVFNSQQWAGDYLDAGVSAIQMQVNNSGATNLSLRLLLIDFANGQSMTSAAAVNVPSGSGWTTISFPLAPDHLTGGDYATTMANVGELNLLHSPAEPPVLSRQLTPPIVATLGVDNITAVAVPEPAAGAVVALGCVDMMSRGGRRRARGISR